MYINKIHFGLTLILNLNYKSKKINIISVLYIS
jgi:hypothetical protein